MVFYKEAATVADRNEEDCLCDKVLQEAVQCILWAEDINLSDVIPDHIKGFENLLKKNKTTQKHSTKTNFKTC